MPHPSSALRYSGAAPTAVPKVDFAREIRPILSDRCFSCHGPDAQNRKADLRLDTRAGVDARPGVVVAGSSAKSRLFLRVNAKSARMPPTGPPLTEAQIAKLKQWLDEGGTWTEHWSYAAPVRPSEPTVKTAAWPKMCCACARGSAHSAVTRTRYRIAMKLRTQGG